MKTIITYFGNTLDNTIMMYTKETKLECVGSGYDLDTNKRDWEFNGTLTDAEKEELMDIGQNFDLEIEEIGE